MRCGIKFWGTGMSDLVKLLLLSAVLVVLAIPLILDYLEFGNYSEHNGRGGR